MQNRDTYSESCICNTVLLFATYNFVLHLETMNEFNISKILTLNMISIPARFLLKAKASYKTQHVRRTHDHLVQTDRILSDSP